MDDNELENEQDKRAHELELARLTNPRTGWVAFWEMLGENFFWLILLVGVICAAVVSIRTGQKFSW